MTTHRRDRFPLSVSVITATGVSAVWPALTAEDIVARRIAFAVMLVLLALAIFILGVQMWGWVRGIESRIRFLAWRVDERLETLSRRAGDLDCQMDSMMSLVRHSRAHRGRLPAAELLLEVDDPPDREDRVPVVMEPPKAEVSRRFPGLGRLVRAHPGAASAAAAGVLVAAGAAGVAVLLTGPDAHRHPASVPEAIRPHTPLPEDGGPTTTPGPTSTPPPTVVLTVTAPAVPRQEVTHGEYVAVPVPARNQSHSQPPRSQPSNSPPPSTTASGTPAAEDEPCLIEVGAQCGVTTTSTLIGP